MKKIKEKTRSACDPYGFLVFGAYGEASADVHALLRVAADELAEQQWRLAGARTKNEMRAYLISKATTPDGYV